MTKVNNEIKREIENSDCDHSIKLFLEEMLEYELNLIENESTDSKKAIGAVYKTQIANFSKQWEVNDEI